MTGNSGPTLNRVAMYALLFLAGVLYSHVHRSYFHAPPLQLNPNFKSLLDVRDLQVDSSAPAKQAVKQAVKQAPTKQPTLRQTAHLAKAPSISRPASGAATTTTLCKSATADRSAERSYKLPNNLTVALPYTSPLSKLEPPAEQKDEILMPTSDLMKPYALHTYNMLRWLEEEGVRERMREMVGRVCIITQYFSERNANAQHAAIQLNLLNPTVGLVMLLQETDEFQPLFATFANAHKIAYVVIGKRLQLADFIEAANTHVKGIMDAQGQALIAMALNSDVVTDLSLMNLHAMLLPGWERGVMFISRKRTFMENTTEDDVNLRDQCALYQGSADGFAFVPPLVPAQDSIFDMYLGEFAVEGRFHFETKRLGWKGLNPCKFVGLWHYHLETEESRNARASETSLRTRRHPERAEVAPWPASSLPRTL